MNGFDIEQLNKTVKTLGWYFSEKQTPTGLYATIGRIETSMNDLNRNLGEVQLQLKKLNINIETASTSSDKLSNSLNRISLVGVGATIVAAVATILGLVPNFYATFFR